MNSDEQAIIDYLKGWPRTFVSGREIGRRAGGKRRYNEDRGWAVPILANMVEKGWIDSDCMGHFRIKLEDGKKKNHLRRHIAPHLLRILRNSGKNFEGVTTEHDLDLDLDPEDQDKIQPLSKPKLPEASSRDDDSAGY